MYKTVSRKMQCRTRQGSRRWVSDRDRKINAKIAKRNAAHKQRLAEDIAAYEARYGQKK
jgi:hypothetical protein